MSENSQSKASLYIVATPIGNLADMTGRAIEVLKSVDLIAAEDTRHSGRLLQHFGIGTRMMSYHDFSEDYRVDSLLEKLSSGLSVALISDAGTPLISDPGYRLVVRARAAGITVVPVPGVCALTTALSVAGLPSDRFAFEGFVSSKRASRVKQFEEWLPEARTMIFYESPHRILECVEDMLTVFGPDRHVVLCRELTKTFETIHGDNLGDLLPWMQNDSNQQRGEFVVLIKGAEATKSEEVDAEALRVLGILLEDLSVKQAASLAARITGVKKNLLYQRALQGVMVS
jgi:16S rRNA (cytidine1402-2'-O)-methyltransferase